MPARLHDLAQVNIATMRAPFESALFADFIAALGPVNALADSSPGFVWQPFAPSGVADEKSQDVRIGSLV